MQSSYPAYQDFCMLVLRKFREEDEEEFIKVMFKVGGRPRKKEKCVLKSDDFQCMCGTDPHPVGFRAKKYKVCWNQHWCEIV